MAWPKLRKSGPDARTGDDKPAEVKPASALVQRLARKLGELPAKDALRIQAAEALEKAQQRGGEELHEVCRTFVEALNGLQEALVVDLSPGVFHPEVLDTPGTVLIQINASGRILQLSILPREAAYSSDQFRLPYVLRGAIRWFNQELLDRHLVEEHQIFYCRERGEHHWLYQNPRTRKTGAIDSDYLAECLEQLL
ncbi:MAG: hypothetical protein HY820_00615 [Acidobacteria bacterium]|nr:hypothetical protein [Acidobacteriota bacterium]